MILCGRRTLKVLRLLHNKNRYALAAGLFATFLLVIAAAVSAGAQEGAMSPYQGEQDGVSAGGKWIEFQSEDKMTGAKKVRFELLSNNYFKEDPDSKPRVAIVCSNGKYEYADFNPGERLGRPDYPGFWGQPKMEVMVRIDRSHDHKGWNWVRGHFLALHDFCGVVADPDDSVGAHLGRVFGHALISVVSGFFAKLGEQSDVAAHQCLQAGADCSENGA